MVSRQIRALLPAADFLAVHRSGSTHRISELLSRRCSTLPLSFKDHYFVLVTIAGGSLGAILQSETLLNSFFLSFSLLFFFIRPGSLLFSPSCFYSRSASSSIFPSLLLSFCSLAVFYLPGGTQRVAHVLPRFVPIRWKSLACRKSFLRADFTTSNVVTDTDMLVVTRSIFL